MRRDIKLNKSTPSLASIPEDRSIDSQSFNSDSSAVSDYIHQSVSRFGASLYEGATDLVNYTLYPVTYLSGKIIKSVTGHAEKTVQDLFRGVIFPDTDFGSSQRSDTAVSDQGGLKDD